MNGGAIMKKRKYVLLILLSLIAVFSLTAAEQITRIGIVDSERVANTYIFESKAYVDFEALKVEIADKIKSIQAQIAELEEKKITAYEAGNQRQELGFAEEIQNQTNYLNEYMRWGKNEIKAAQQRITASNDEFYQKLAKAIADTAEAEGFSLVLDKKKVDIWYYIDEVDITDSVIKAMNRMYG